VGKQEIISPLPRGRGSERGWTFANLAFIVWLVLYYGSWTIADPLVRETNVLTISYVRYWLPIAIILAFWAAVGFRWVLDRCVARWRPSVAVLMLLGIAFTSFAQVITDPAEGLLRQREAIAEHRARARAVIAATERDAVIVSHRMDKVFFPERAVVHVPAEPDADFRKRLAMLLTGAPVYWYATSAPPLSPEFVWTPVGAMPFGEQLYRVRAAELERGWKGSARPPRMGEAGVAQGVKPLVKVL
ncbi:MAG: hypothetical protein Q7S02_05920, partial [bacterium]|nr:hypothetical protein [bacterium]